MSHQKSRRAARRGYVVSGLLPTDLDNLDMWFRFNTGITVTGQGVSTWADQSGNGRDLVQATDDFRPSLESDNSLLCDGVEDGMRITDYVRLQPTTFYLLMKQVTWTINRTFTDGGNSNTALIRQTTSSPNISLHAGSNGDNNGDLAINVYSVISAVFNGASSVLQVNKNAPVISDAGASDTDGLAMGFSAGTSADSNSQFKEIIVYAAAHDAATRIQIINYLSDVGKLGL